MVDEAQLMLKIARGDREALRVIYEIHASKVYNMALRRVGNASLANDITQDVFLTIYDKSIDFRGDAKVGTWLYRIAFNKCMDEINKRKKHSNSNEFTEQVHLQSIPASPEQEIGLDAILGAIDKLKESQKQAFTLVYLDKIPQKEVAEILNMNIKALESLLFRARSSLQNILSKNKGF
jgi:RNA polymerase sigma-70 factor (ECF subfamily)